MQRRRSWTARRERCSRWERCSRCKGQAAECWRADRKLPCCCLLQPSLPRHPLPCAKSSGVDARSASASINATPEAALPSGQAAAQSGGQRSGSALPGPAKRPRDLFSAGVPPCTSFLRAGLRMSAWPRNLSPPASMQPKHQPGHGSLVTRSLPGRVVSPVRPAAAARPASSKLGGAVGRQVGGWVVTGHHAAASSRAQVLRPNTNTDMTARLLLCPRLSDTLSQSRSSVRSLSLPPPRRVVAHARG